jgi:hypothetical protein
MGYPDEAGSVSGSWCLPESLGSGSPHVLDAAGIPPNNKNRGQRDQPSFEHRVRFRAIPIPAKESVVYFPCRIPKAVRFPGTVLAPVPGLRHARAGTGSGQFSRSNRTKVFPSALAIHGELVDPNPDATAQGRRVYQRLGTALVKFHLGKFPMVGRKLYEQACSSGDRLSGMEIQLAGDG